MKVKLAPKSDALPVFLNSLDFSPRTPRVALQAVHNLRFALDFEMMV